MVYSIKVTGVKWFTIYPRMTTTDDVHLEVTASWCIASKEQELSGLQFIRDRALELGMCQNFLDGQPGSFMVMGIVTDVGLFDPQDADDLTDDVARLLFSSEFICLW